MNDQGVKTVRIRADTHAMLEALARLKGKNYGEVIEELVGNEFKAIKAKAIEEPESFFESFVRGLDE